MFQLDTGISKEDTRVPFVMDTILDGREFKLTFHAVARAKERGIIYSDILLARQTGECTEVGINQYKWRLKVANNLAGGDSKWISVVTVEDCSDVILVKTVYVEKSQTSRMSVDSLIRKVTVRLPHSKKSRRVTRRRISDLRNEYNQSSSD